MDWSADAGRRRAYRARHAAAGPVRRPSRETLVTIGLLALIPVLLSVGPLGASVLLLRAGAQVAGSGPAQSLAVAVAVGLALAATIVAACVVFGGRGNRRDDEGRRR